MAATISSITVDGGGEDATISISGNTGTLAGTLAITLHRTPGGAVTPIATKISGTTITINGLQDSSNNPTYIRNGEVVTLDLSGLTDATNPVTAVTGVKVTNKSERDPRVLGEDQFLCNENTPTTGNLSSVDGYAQIMFTDTDGNQKLRAEVQIRNGVWQYPQTLDIGIAYTIYFYDEQNNLLNTKSFQQ